MKDSQYWNKSSLFVLLFVFHVIWIFQGLDVIESGFHLTNQVLAFSGHDNKTPIMIFLTDYIGGVWLSLAGSPDLIWARLGGVFIFCLTALTSYHVLSTLFDRKRVFYIVAISTILITMTIPNIIIDYYSFPAFLMNIGLLFIHQIWRSEDDPKRRNIYSFLLGFLVIPIILSRFPLIMFFFIPVIVVVYYRLTKQRLVALSSIAKYSFLGFVTSLGIFALFYHSLGLLSIFENRLVAELTMTSNRFNFVGGERHSFRALQTVYDMFKLYIQDILFISGSTMILIMILYIATFVRKKMPPTVPYYVVNMLIMIILGSSFLVCRYIFDLHIDLVIAVLVGIISVITVIYFFCIRERSNHIAVLLLTSFYTMVIFPLGSDGSFTCRTIYGMWLILPLTLILSYDLMHVVKKEVLSRMLSLNTAIMLLLLPIAIFANYRNAFRDDLNRIHLTTPFKYEYLNHVFSGSERVEVVDQVLKQIRIFTEKGDKVLMVGGMNIFYYLTETRPIWPIIWTSPKIINDLSELIDRLDDESKYPKIIVYSKVYLSANYWPLDPPKGYSAFEKKYFMRMEYLKNLFKEKLHYDVVWENKAFIICQRVVTGMKL